MGIAVVEVRQMTAADVGMVAGLEEAYRDRPWTETVFRDELAADNRIYLVGTVGDEIVGFAGAMVSSEVAHVTNLLVAADHRRRGVGKRLMETLIAEVVDQGARHLTLEVRTQNDAARQLYHDLGFVPVAFRPGYYGDDDALVLWAHDIDRPGHIENN